MDGFVLLDLLRSEPDTAGIPIYVISGGDLAADALSLGAAEVIEKPVERERLIALFGSVAKRKTRKPAAARARKKAAKPGRELLGKRILIVDDDIRNIYSLTSVLEARGASVLHAERGQEGIDLLEAQPDIDVALIDIMMPEMDGYETMRRIRAKPEIADIPLMAVTAKAMVGDRQKCLDAGASDYVAKPVDIDVLDGAAARDLRARGDRPTREPQRIEGGRVSEPAPTARQARVLVVDDDERNLLALSEVLAPIAEVVCSSSGRDALRQLLRDEFAVILLDVFMPDLDGYETAALIRQREQTASIPIIFLSAVNKETEHLMRGYEMGAVDYVFKPVDPVVLKSKVAVFVDLFSTRRRLEESEKRQASILRALPMAIYEVTERDGELLRQFRGGDLAHFLGDQVDAVQRGERQWHDWVHPADRKRLSQEPERGGDSVTVEYRWIGPQGARHHILDQRIATGTGSGPRSWAGSLLDITERKELEARLVHAGKLDALGQLTGGVAHDFNNLLAAMLGGISILQRRLTFGEREQIVVDQMRHAATQGAELVRRMMAFARQQELSPGSVDPATLCDVGGRAGQSHARRPSHGELGMPAGRAQFVRRS